jgi:hypothetical protein
MELIISLLPDGMVRAPGFDGEDTGGLELDAVSQIDAMPCHG